MIRPNELAATEEPEVEALLAFDRALAAGNDLPSSSNGGSASFLGPVHECQRLLEAVWPRSDSTSFEFPREFGRFSIVRELGRGGFGVVFLAEDRVLGRQVALKMPRPEVLVTPEVRRRFLREAEAASRFDHPHIVPVFEVGEEGPICYIASAYCEGLTLAQWLREQTAPVSIRLASRLVAIVAAAVAHAHERGILHRDLKPGNILLQQRGGDTSATEDLGFVPRICDFGLAKLLDQVSQETRSGMPIGSPAYMAPEQATGRLREHGPATDVYVLGVILYELLTGRPPHRGETDLETIRLVSVRGPPSPRALRPGLARDLDTIVLKCLEKLPDRRYTRASELVEDLQRFLDGRPVKARPVPAWARASKWASRRPAHAALLVVIVLSVSAILGGVKWARQSNNELRTALDQSRRSETAVRVQRNEMDRENLNLRRDNFVKGVQRAGSLRADELEPRLQKRERTGESPGESFQLADILAVTPDDGGTMAVSLETGEVLLYLTVSGYCQAVCHVGGVEAVFAPRTNLLTPYSQVELGDIERAVRSLTLRAKSRSIRANFPIVCARFAEDDSCRDERERRFQHACKVIGRTSEPWNSPVRARRRAA
jgi:serine/threonine protein kinase